MLSSAGSEGSTLRPEPKNLKPEAAGAADRGMEPNRPVMRHWLATNALPFEEPNRCKNTPKAPTQPPCKNAITAAQP